MGYASQVPSEQVHLLEKVQQSLIALAESALGGAEDALATMVLQQPGNVSQIAAKFVQAINGVTVESTDAQIDSALASAGTISALKAHFGIS